MHASVVTVSATAEQLEQGARLRRGRVLPIIQAQPGFKGHYRLLDRKGEMIMVITLWESEQALQAASAAVLPVLQQMAQALGMAPPESQVFEVTEQA
jgi:heme-degrading monooxygenase HmoA